MGKKPPTKPSAFLDAVRAKVKNSRRLAALTDDEFDQLNEGITSVEGNISAANLAALIQTHFNKKVSKTVLVEHLREWRVAHGKA